MRCSRCLCDLCICSNFSSNAPSLELLRECGGRHVLLVREASMQHAGMSEAEVRDEARRVLGRSLFSELFGSADAGLKPIRTSL